MSVGAEVYRRVGEGDDLAAGDIAYLTLARTRLTGEAPPGDTYDPVGRIPAFPRPAIFALAHDREVAVDSMFALIVTHSCEIDRQKNAGVGDLHVDCRITVAPIVPEGAVLLVGQAGEEQSAGWNAIAANQPVASLYLPPLPDVSAQAAGVDPLPWPRCFADLRGLSTVSRRMVIANRLMGLAPEYVAVLQRQLARFFTWRDLARHDLIEAMVGRRIADAIPLNARGDLLRVALLADDGSSVTVDLRTR